MGLLDSNKFSELLKKGSFTCDLTSSAAQNNIPFGGASFATLVLDISGLSSSGAEVKVRGAVVSDASVLTAKDNNGVTKAITSDGKYYISVLGITDVYFQVTTTAESGSCTIRWALSPKEFSYGLGNDVKSILSGMNNQSSSFAAETFSFASASYFKDIDLSVDGKVDYRCVCLVVTAITDGASFSAYSNLATADADKLIAYDLRGRLLTEITEKGTYYIVVPSPCVVKLRNVALSDASVTFNTFYLKAIPAEVLNLKAVQLIKKATVSITGTSIIAALSYSDTVTLKYFKYFYITYGISNGGSAVNRNIIITVQPYHDGGKAGKAAQIYEGSNSYNGQTEWQEVNATDGMRVYITCSNRVEGDKILVGVYGVR